MGRQRHQRKNRGLEVGVKFDKDVVVTGFHVRGDGRIELSNSDGEVLATKSVNIGYSYERNSGKRKVLNRILCKPGQPAADINEHLTKFGSLFAIDTNTKEIQGSKVSVTVSLMFRNISFNRVKWTFDFSYVDGFVFHDCVESPEAVGWKTVVEAIPLEGFPRPVGIIVDSELDKLSAINARTRPIVGDYFLPDGFEMIFATRDAGTEEFAPNAGIRQASRLLLNRLQSGADVQNGFPVNDKPYARARVIPAKEILSVLGIKAP